jgi:hypothetical protein
MVRILSRISALVMAGFLVMAAGWALTRPYMYDANGYHGPVILCFCYIFTVRDDAEWQQLFTGLFGIRSPSGTAVHAQSSTEGTISHRLFDLTYTVGMSGSVAPMPVGPQAREEAIIVGGRQAVLRSQWVSGRSDPFYVQLVVPQVFQDREGRWLALEIHGWMKTYERAWLAERVLKTLDFAPPYDIPIAPVRPRVLPPVIEIERVSEEIAP